MDHEINLDWVVKELGELKVMGEVVTRARILNDKLLAIAKEKVTDGKISFIEFFSLTAGIRFALELIEERHYMPPVDIHARRSQQVIPRATLPTDVDVVIERLRYYWEIKYRKLNELKEVELLIKAEANKWLDLLFKCKQDLVVERSWLKYRVTDDIPPETIEEVGGRGGVELVSDDLERIVRYHEYGLSIELEEKAKHILPLTYSLSELANRWGTNEKNIIAICNQYQNLWAYISLTNEFRLENFHHKVVVLETKNKILNGEVDTEYKYPCRGYARIAKKTVANGGITLEYFHANSVVNAKVGSLTLLWIEPPLCNRVLGVYSQHLEADKPFSPTLYFMQDEAHNFERSQEFKKLFPNSEILQKLKGSRNKAAVQNGKLSGKIRADESVKIWSQRKKPLLKLAREHAPITGNRLAEIAAERDIISDEEVSNIGKKVRSEPDFKQYLKLRK